MALLEVPLSGRRRSHRVPVGTASPHSSCRFGKAALGHLVWPHIGGASSGPSWSGAREIDLDACVGPVDHGCSPGRPRGDPRDGHRRRRLPGRGQRHPARCAWCRRRRSPPAPPTRGRPPQPRLRPHRRHARRRPRPHADHAPPAGRPGHGVHRRHLPAPAVLPRARPARDGPVRPEQRRAAQPRGPRWLPGPRPHAGGERVVPRRGLPHRVRRQVPQRLRPPRRAPRGLVEVGRADPRRLRLRQLLHDR